MPRRDYTDLPSGRVETMDLVNQMRAHRGRLTRRQLCESLGLDPNVRRNFDIVCQLCKEFGLTVADPGRVDPAAKPMPKPNAAAEQRLAKEQLAREIALAQMERPYAPPYKYGGALEW